MSELPAELREKLRSLIATDDVVLFMKGTRDAPRCGFSAAVVEILDDVVPSYFTVDVLSDPDVREAIKVYSDWPTIPQLYIKGEFVGGADIAKEMYGSGELHEKLGRPRTPLEVVVTVTPAAAAALKEAREGEDEDNRFLRFAVSSRFEHQLGFSPKEDGDVVIETEGLSVVVDRQSARRAHGVVIDAVPQGSGIAFRIQNPNEPPRVKDIGPRELKQRLEEGAIELFDVRNEGERAIASIEAARLFDDAARAYIEGLPKETPLYFHCHHGGRSRRAAEMFLQIGFRTVYNLAGGIDAWAVEVDPQVKRY